MIETDFAIRRKQREDCEAVEHIITLAWNETYTGIVPDEFLKNLYNSEAKRIRNKFNNFNVHENHTFVLEVDNNIVGFVNVGESKEAGFADSGEIYALYLLNNYKGCGFGRKLFETGIEESKNMGYKRILVGCLQENESNGFYKHIGGIPVKERIFKELGLPENLYLFEKI